MRVRGKRWHRNEESPERPTEPDLRLSGTGTFLAERSPITLSGTARLSVTSDPARNLDAAGVVERFAPDAFAGVVGQVVPMRLARGVGHWVRITVADVAEDGSSVTLRLEPADGPDD